MRTSIATAIVFAVVVAASASAHARIGVGRDGADPPAAQTSVREGTMRIVSRMIGVWFARAIIVALGLIRMKLLMAAGAILTLVVFGPNPAEATPSGCEAIAGNLVTNCGFEGGTSTVDHEIEPNGWTFTPGTFSDSAASSVVGDAHAGTGFYIFGSGGTDDEISQLINVTVGHEYEIEFWLSPDGNSPSDFTAMFGDTTLVSLTDPAAVTDSANNNYELFTFDETGTAPMKFVQLGVPVRETLAFFGADQPGFISLDDVSVVDLGVPTTVPEPASLMLFGAGIAGLAFFRRARQA